MLSGHSTFWSAHKEYSGLLWGGFTRVMEFALKFDLTWLWDGYCKKHLRFNIFCIFTQLIKLFNLSLCMEFCWSALIDWELNLKLGKLYEHGDIANLIWLILCAWSACFSWSKINGYNLLWRWLWELNVTCRILININCVLTHYEYF